MIHHCFSFTALIKIVTYKMWQILCFLIKIYELQNTLKMHKNFCKPYLKYLGSYYEPMYMHINIKPHIFQKLTDCNSYFRKDFYINMVHAKIF